MAGISDVYNHYNQLKRPSSFSLIADGSKIHSIKLSSTKFNACAIFLILLLEEPISNRLLIIIIIIIIIIITILNKIKSSSLLCQFTFTLALVILYAHSLGSPRPKSRR